MAIYRITDGKNFEQIPEISFEAEGIWERRDLQRMLSVQPDVLEEGLFILCNEYSYWEETNRRIDLLALDKEGRLVVVELKRSDWDDSHMELQAVRAALVANMTVEQAIDAHRMYLAVGGASKATQNPASSTTWAGTMTDALIDSENPRIILASANFSKELTTSVLWLRSSWSRRYMHKAATLQ